MIHASVAKLNIHIGDTGFDRVMEEINAAQEEGLQTFEIEGRFLDTQVVLDILRALSDLGYQAEYDYETEMFEVSYDE